MLHRDRVCSLCSSFFILFVILYVFMCLLDLCVCKITNIIGKRKCRARGGRIAEGDGDLKPTEE